MSKLKVQAKQPPAAVSSELRSATKAQGGQRPGTEIREPQRRRVFSPKWKIEFLERLESCENETERGKLIRKEGVYFSQVSKWKKAKRERPLSIDSTGKRGPSLSRTKEMMDLEKENARLAKELMQAKQIIELQKKVAALFGTE
jgi:transposase